MTRDAIIDSKVEINLRTKSVRDMGRGFAKMYVADLGKEILEAAQYNVTEGVGPGPHPHKWPHVDTGKLRESLRLDLRSQGFLETAHVFSDDPVGAWLEFGYIPHFGSSRVIYPWLSPAYTKVLDSSSNYLRTTARMWFNSRVQNSIERHGLIQILSKRSGSFSPRFGLL